ncbi:MAG: UbiA family prenyltransferase [Capsulimonadaceae bacterium]
MTNRWWVYQKERFPLAAHGPLVAVFSYSALCYSSMLRHQPHPPGMRSALVAFVTALLIFLQLRIADEFKDFEEDSRYRPYRPVPRGLIKLRELGIVFVAAGVVQLVLALSLCPSLAWILLIPWTYLALMSKEFFARRWLKAHPFTYLWSHMLIMPLVDFYVTACDWMASGAPVPRGLAWFLVISFFNGIVLEFGRKIRAPVDEEHGVETYTALWGIRTALSGWLAALVLTTFCAWQAARIIHYGVPVAAVTLTMVAVAVVSAVSFVRSPSTASARRIEVLSGLWTLLMYVSLGMAPRLLR